MSPARAPKAAAVAKPTGSSKAPAANAGSKRPKTKATPRASARSKPGSVPPAAEASPDDARVSQQTTPKVDDANVFAAYDEALLDICRTRWQFGDWAGLAALGPEQLRHHPERGRIALLVASAHFQLGQTLLAHRLMQAALDWGASYRQAAQMLISGTHHSLAEARGLLNQPEPSREHFRQAIRAGGVPGDVELLAHARALRNNISTS